MSCDSNDLRPDTGLRRPAKGRDDLTRRIVRRHVAGHSLAAIARALGSVRYRLDKTMPALREALADLDPSRRPD